ncbi:AAA family ATPase [Puia sp. P3]|uniref:AAA family ATPase n=1 Tax=Puia sp. P3 TaxID=3423952 RepID=UPI003D67FCCC
MEKLIVKNFGPIVDAELLIKDINIFIGTTSSGKSTVAKLVAILKGPVFRANPDRSLFLKSLVDYNIPYAFVQGTSIRYENGDSVFEIAGQFFTTNWSVYPPPADEPIYVPAERVFFPTFSQSIFSLISNNVALPKSLVDFGAKFETARKSFLNHSVDFLGVEYVYEGNTDYVRVSDQVKIKLSEASSGLQSVIPLFLVVSYYTLVKGDLENLFVIEEPEINLYPSSQKELVDFLISRIKEAHDKLIITTHSPYLLTAIDNLIQADNVVKENSAAATEAVADLIPTARWINFDQVSCYYFDRGTCRSTPGYGDAFHRSFQHR